MSSLTNYLLVISLNLYLVLIVFSGLLKGRDAVQWRDGNRKTNSLVQTYSQQMIEMCKLLGLRERKWGKKYEINSSLVTCSSCNFQATIFWFNVNEWEKYHKSLIDISNKKRKKKKPEKSWREISFSRLTWFSILFSPPTSTVTETNKIWKKRT